MSSLICTYTFFRHHFVLSVHLCYCERMAVVSVEVFNLPHFKMYATYNEVLFTGV